MNPHRLIAPLQRLTWLAGLLWLAGCAHKGFTPPPDILAHQQQLQAITHWTLSGKLGIRTPDENGNATLKWAQEQANYQINLSGPLGQKHMIITGAPGKVRLEQSGSPALEAKSAEALIKKAAGWTLPVAQLGYWVRGTPAPELRITQLQQNELGLLAQLEQNGWTIEYSNYQNYPLESATGPQLLALPGKISASRAEVRLILVVRHWHLGQ